MPLSSGTSPGRLTCKKDSRSDPLKGNRDYQTLLSFLHDLKIGARSLWRAKGLTLTVIATMALGIGANAAMFSLVRAVLLRPLVNRDEDHLIYIRQSSKDMGGEDTAFSVPEIADLRARVKTLNSFGEFSGLEFTMMGLGEPRTVRAGVVNGSYFAAMGLRPVLGRLVDTRDDGPKAAGAVVLTYRFWSTTLHSDPNVIGKSSGWIPSIRAALPSSACSSRASLIRRTPKSSPIWSPARITCPQPWLPTAFTG